MQEPTEGSEIQNNARTNQRLGNLAPSTISQLEALDVFLVDTSDASFSTTASAFDFSMDKEDALSNGMVGSTKEYPVRSGGFSGSTNIVGDQKRY